MLVYNHQTKIDSDFSGKCKQVVRRLKKPGIKELLNFNYSYVSNKTISVGKYDLPKYYANLDFIPDFISLYSEKYLYFKTEHTCIAFFENDINFDGLNGLYNGIYYNNNKILEYYRKRFEGVKYFITPDITMAGDAHLIENLYRLFKMRILSIWLKVEIGAEVIPLVTYSNMDFFQYMLQGIEETNIICMSTKGSSKKKDDVYLLFKAIKYVTDSLKNLKTIIVYSVSSTQTTLNQFSYAINKGINVVIPDNTLKQRNFERKCEVHG